MPEPHDVSISRNCRQEQELGTHWSKYPFSPCRGAACVNHATALGTYNERYTIISATDQITHTLDTVAHKRTSAQANKPTNVHTQTHTHTHTHTHTTHGEQQLRIYTDIRAHTHTHTPPVAQQQRINSLSPKRGIREEGSNDNIMGVLIIHWDEYVYDCDRYY